MASLIEKNQVLFPPSPGGRPREKKFRSDMTTEFISFPSIVGDVHTSHGTAEIRDLFGADVFDFPKPSEFIRRLIEQCSRGEDVVMDLFAGSCTTAHALLRLNREGDQRRRFLMVQLPEPTPPDSQANRAGFNTIAELGTERMRRLIHRMQAEDTSKLTTGRDEPEDLGFKVFKLDHSNYKAWRDFDAGEVVELQTLFDRFESPLVDGWKPEDVLVEVMLIEGFPLDSAISELPQYKRNRVRQVASEMLGHRLFICLDAHVHDETIAALTMGEDDIFICLDSALSDEAKVQLEDGRRVKVI